MEFGKTSSAQELIFFHSHLDFSRCRYLRRSCTLSEDYYYGSFQKWDDWPIIILAILVLNNV